MWGIRANKLQNKVIYELHREHPGVVRMKCIAKVMFDGLGLIRLLNM